MTAKISLVRRPGFIGWGRPSFPCQFTYVPPVERACSIDCAPPKSSAVDDEMSTPEPEPVVDISQFRAPAVQAKRKAQKLAEKAARANERGDYKAAQLLSAQAVEGRTKAATMEEVAAEEIFAAKNAARPLDVIDLHGLYGHEALRFLERRLAEIALTEGQVSRLTVITGWGRGQSGVPILKPLVEEFLRNNALSFRTANAGAFVISL